MHVSRPAGAATAGPIGVRMDPTPPTVTLTPDAVALLRRAVDRRPDLWLRLRHEGYG